MRTFRSTTAERRHRIAAAWIASLAAVMTIAGCQVSGTPSADPAAVSSLAAASEQAPSLPTTPSPTLSTPTDQGTTTGSIDGTSSSDPESSADSSHSLTVMTLTGDADRLIGTIWAQALSHRGYRVTVRSSSADQATTQQALQAGEVDIAASYTGYALDYYRKGSTGSPEVIYQKLVQSLPAEIGALPAAKAESNYAIAVTAKTAQRYKLNTIADLAKNKKAMSLAIPDFWITTPEVKNALFASYGLSGLATKQSTDLDGAKTVAMLTGGQTSAAVLFTTSPAVDKQHLVLLTDNKYAFGANFVVPLIHKQSVDPTAQKALNAVDAQLDTATLRRLTTEVSVDGHSAAAVADEWLASIGLG